jgi:hypothetical protein
MQGIRESLGPGKRLSEKSVLVRATTELSSRVDKEEKMRQPVLTSCKIAPTNDASEPQKSDSPIPRGVDYNYRGICRVDLADVRGVSPDTSALSDDGNRSRR